jgi:hypothetical protein
MSSIVERLTEGVVNRDMRAESHALLSKWKKTGLLEGLEGERQANSMARLLENQAKELLREANSMSSGDVEGFAAVAFPIVRRVFAGLIANDLVSVQPMSLPSGLIFFLDFTFSGDLGGVDGVQDRRFGNVAGDSIYGTDRVGSQVTGGVNLVGSLGGDLSGPGIATARGYAYASPTGSLEVAAAQVGVTRVILSGTAGANMSVSDAKKIQFDPDLLAVADAAGTNAFVELSIPEAQIPSDLDTNNLAAVDVTPAQMAALTGAFGSSNVEQVRRLNRRGDSGELLLYFVGPTSILGDISVGSNDGDLTGSYPQRDTVGSDANVRGAIAGFDMPFEGNADIPEIDIKVDSIAVTAQTKKLKAKWTPELGQDLNAYHNLDAEVELTSLLSEQIALEIDREILADLVNGATAGTRYWSRAPGLFVDSNGNEIGASAKAPDFTGTVSEWYETLVETINDVSAQIHRKTLRGGANFVVCGPEVANILEFTAGFRASVTHTDEKGSIGALKVGSLSKKFDVIVDPYFLRNVILVGRRGSSFLESGYVYAPYVPLQTTPTIFGPEDFVPRKGVMTRYAKKMVRPDMYGLVVVRGLLGESGS